MVKVVGGYELGEVIGKGSFGTVRAATCQRTHTTYAVKIVDKSLLVQDNLESQLKREIMIMKGLRHDNVLQLVEVLQTSNNVYIVLELVRGGELFERLPASRRFTEDQARVFFQQLVVGLFYCHRKGVAHRDLKPENLLIDKPGVEGVLKISDFGLANLQRRDSTGHTVALQTCCGTPNYVAPEVLRGEGYNGFKADVWSCGVILFHMTAGQLPFSGRSITELFDRICKAQFRLPESLSPELKDLITKILNPSVDERLDLGGVIQHTW